MAAVAPPLDELNWVSAGAPPTVTCTPAVSAMAASVLGCSRLRTTRHEES